MSTDITGKDRFSFNGEEVKEDASLEEKFSELFNLVNIIKNKYDQENDMKRKERIFFILVEIKNKTKITSSGEDIIFKLK